MGTVDVFLVTGVYDHEGESPLGVFTTRELAMTKRNAVIADKEEELFGFDEVRIYPMRLDETDFDYLEAKHF